MRDLNLLTKYKAKRGYIMVLALVFLVVLMVFTGALFSQTTNFLRFSARSTTDEQAINLAEAGIDTAIWNINLSPSTYSGETNTQLGPGTFTITVTPKTSTSKTISATGYVPNAAAPRSKRSVKIDVFFDNNTPIPLNYAIQTGNAVQMGAGSTINGSVYSNGPINASSPATITGEAWSASNISSYITVGIPPKHEFQAPLALPQPIPNYASAINAWKDLSCNASPTHVCDPSYVTSCSPCTINTSQTIGPRKYSGDLTITGSSTVVIVNGPIWVSGKLTVSNGAEMKPDNSLGTSGVSVILGQEGLQTGTSTFSISTKLQPNNSNPPGYLGFFPIGGTSQAEPNQIIINTYTPAGGVARAIFYGNGTSGILSYPPSGNIKIADNTTITVGSIVSNVLELGSNSTLTYETGLAGATFVGGSGATWQIKKGTYHAVKPPENKDFIAEYNSTYKAPTCTSVGISCDSGTLLNGRDNVSGMVEANAPNTTDANCYDDTLSGQNSIESVRVYTQNGTSTFKAGATPTTVLIKAKGNFNGSLQGIVDFYYKNATSTPPYWTPVGTIGLFEMNSPEDVGPFEITSQAFSLTGSAGFHVARAQFRDHVGQAASCTWSGPGTDTDESDDLVFSVGN